MKPASYRFPHRAHLVVGHETEDGGRLSAALDRPDRGQRLLLQRVPQQRLEECETVRVEPVLVALDEFVTEPDTQTQELAIDPIRMPG